MILCYYSFAWRLTPGGRFPRAESAVAVSWIAQRLLMGTRGYLAHLLIRPPRPQKKPGVHQPRNPHAKQK